MANQNLQGPKVAILVTDGFEQVELLEPRKALDEAGAKTSVVSPKSGRVNRMVGWKLTERGERGSDRRASRPSLAGAVRRSASARWSS